MGLFSRRKSAGEPPAQDSKSATLAHLRDFVATRVGVEAYLEPATNVTQTTIMLIATDGEWTRRRVPDMAAGRKVAQDLNIPCYDVNFTGYPQRMRDYNARKRRGETS